MGMTPYQILDHRFLSMTITNNNIAVEIGSERGEGSTKFLYNWAKKHGIDFYSIDVVDDAAKNSELTDIKFQIVDSGHIWARDILPSLNKTIKVLYLDNFDWIDPVNLQYNWLHELIESYRSRGVIMNNENSQEEHRLQSMFCIPYMDKQSVVIFDDTWTSQLTESGYDGKCGTSIPLFIEAGFTILQDSTNRIFGYRGMNE